jgi:hypothetical protein
VSSACYVLVLRWSRASRSPTCVGSYRFRSNGRAKVDGRCSATPLGSVLRGRGVCAREFHERIRGAKSRLIAATAGGEHCSERSMDRSAGMRVPRWSHALSQPPPTPRGRLS